MKNLEIERRYLFDAYGIYDLLKENGISFIISDLEQFYLKATPSETLRYRKEDNSYIKNIKKGGGLAREEFEQKVSKKEYKQAKKQNSGGIIKKKRFKFRIDGYKFELDIFKGKLKGLSILEIEFDSLKEAHKFKMPKLLSPFVIKEVTNEAIYTNGALSRSMRIPLRDDSYISLKEIISSQKVKKPKFDLYISATEDTSYVFHNYLHRFFVTFKLNLKEFAKNKEIKPLKRALKAALILKKLLLGFRKYLKDKNTIEALFNLNSFLLEAQRIADLEQSFKLLLEKKQNYPMHLQPKVLRILIKLAQKLKRKKDNLLECYPLKELESLEKHLENIENKKSLKVPYYYAKHKILEKRVKQLKKEINQIRITKTIAKFFNVKVKVKGYKKLKQQEKMEKLIENIKKLDFDKRDKKEILRGLRGEV